MNSIEWSYYRKFQPVNETWLPDVGEGTNAGNQLCVAINKLIYKWYNDGDVFDTTRKDSGGMVGWANDLSDYANWIRAYAHQSAEILDRIYECKESDHSTYENLIKDLADKYLTEDYLSTMASFYNNVLVGSVYDCNGPYSYQEEIIEDEDWDEDEDGEYF